MASWLTPPVTLTGSREFTCDGFTTEDCEWYMKRWHFWYIADHVYALPTVAFFMSAIGLFTIEHLMSSYILDLPKLRRRAFLQRIVAGIRYLSYRGFRISKLRWNSAPLGLCLLAGAGTVYFFCMTLIPQPYYWPSLDFGGSPPLGTRSGWLALACMPFLFATATKTNWITLLTGVSHEKLQVFHRWIAYAFFILALMHAFPFIVYHIHFHDMVMQWEMGNLFYWTGIVALLFQAYLTFASHSVIRNLGYEFFKATHFLAAVMFVLMFFWHCDYTLTSWHYFIATAAVYVPCYGFSWLRTAFEYGLTQKAHLHVEDNGFTKITIPSVDFDWTPGQHCFLRFTSFGLQSVSSHPFTICSSPSSHPGSKGTSSELVFYIRHRRGLTQKLYNHALENSGASVPVMIDGPYGGINMQRFAGADRLLVVAGGSGAGWVLPFVELFCRHAKSPSHGSAPEGINDAVNEKTQSSDDNGEESLKQRPRSLRVILATREASSRVWLRQAIERILSQFTPRDALPNIGVEVYLTGEAEVGLGMTRTTDIEAGVSSSAATSSSQGSHQNGKSLATSIANLAEDIRGRPALPGLVHEEGAQAAEQNKSLAVFVCGPDAMLHDVRNSVAQENLRVVKGGKPVDIYLHAEHFSWA